MEKINGNVKRDGVNYAKLIDAGWKPLIIWECEIEDRFKETVYKAIQQLEYGNK